MAKTKSLPTQKDFDATQQRPDVMTIVMPSLSGKMTSKTAMTIPAYFSAVRFISDTIASLPAYICQTKDDYSNEVDHPLAKLLQRQINGICTPYTFFQTLVSHAVGMGNGYAAIRRDAQGNVAALRNIDPEVITPFVFEDEKWFLLKVDPNYQGPKVVYNGATHTAIHGSNIIHLPGLGSDGVRGYSLPEIAGGALSADISAQDHTREYYGRGGFVGGSVEIPGRITPDQRSQLEMQLREYCGHGEKAYRLMLLSGGGTLKPFAINNQTSQLLETRKYSIVVVAQFMRVNPIFLYDLGRATWGNAEQFRREAQSAILNWVKPLEQEISAKLLPESELASGYSVKFNMDSLLRSDPAALATALSGLVNSGLLSINEARRELDYAPDTHPDSNRLRIPVAVSQVNDNPMEPSKPDDAPVDPAEEPDIQPEDSFSALAPIIDSTLLRVHTRAEKQLEKPKDIKAFEAFKSGQLDYLKGALEPILSCSACSFEVNKDAVYAEYSASLDELRDTGSTTRTLIEIVKDNSYEKPKTNI